MSIEGSEIEIIYDGDDIARSCVIAEAKFTAASNATPGTAELILRDVRRDLGPFVTGKRLKCRIDGQDMWSGFSLINGRSNFFPAGDGKEDTRSRQFVLHGIDNNILLDALVLRRPADYLKAIPNITSDTMDGALIRQAFADYIDTPGFLDTTTFVDDVMVPAGGSITSADPWAWPQQGSKVRAMMDDLSSWSSAVFYIGPDDCVHYHALQDIECPWGFSDRPNRAPITGSGGFEDAYYGFREINADEDGSELATDALVWGGSPFAGAGSTVFKRATDSTMETEHGKWQLAETHFGETNFKTQKTVNQRANMIVFGNPTGTGGGSEPGSVPGEGPRGLRFSQWAYNFGWSTKDVPEISGVRRHLYPGDIVPIQLWMYSEDGGTTPLTKFLPLRSLAFGFSGAKDGKAHVMFRGGFDLRNTDSKFLWSFLRRREPQIIATTLATATNDSTSTQTGAFGQFEPTPAADGSTTVFTIPFGYIPNTTIVSIDGVDQPRGTVYTESDPDAGEITFADPPETDENLWVVCRTLAGGS